MSWLTTIWMSATLLVATSALHLTIEHDVLAYETTTTPKVKENKKQEFLQVFTDSEERVSGSNNKKALTAQQLGIYLNEHTTSSTKFPNKFHEKDDVKVEPMTLYNGESSSEITVKPGSVTSSEEGSGTNGDNGSGVIGGAGGSENDNGNGSNGANSEENNDAVSVETNYDEKIVETTTGPVRGYMWREKGNIISYIDIQYGTFKNPFEAPVFPNRSEKIHEVKIHNKRCPQLQDDLYVGDADCLTLSIFKPSDATNTSVLFHIHEGNFIDGSANPAIYGPEYLVSKGIILVLPNYRLGPLGFLCLQNEIAPGNAALKDLSLALRWVKANIAKFGGNPKNIAVSGDGTAGALAGYLALSAMSKQNVNKVITESGSVLSHWALDRNPILAATELAKNIDGFQSWQSIEPSVLVSAAKNIVFRPCLEKETEEGEHFLVETPWAMIEDQEIKISFMIGSAKYAGVHESLNQTESSIQQINDDVALLLPNDLRFETRAERIRFGNKVKAQYFGEANISVSDVEPLTLYFTDTGYLGPGIRTARPLVQSGATVYFYEFSFFGDFNRELEAIQTSLKGAVRGDIIGYLFTQDGVVPEQDTNERRMVDTLVELWTSFIKNGTPVAENIEWNRLEKADVSEEQWLSIEAEASLKKGLHLDRLSLWTNIYDQHFVDKSLAFGTSPNVCTVLLLQVVFFISFFMHASHFF